MNINDKRWCIRYVFCLAIMILYIILWKLNIGTLNNDVIRGMFIYFVFDFLSSIVSYIIFN